MPLDPKTYPKPDISDAAALSLLGQRQTNYRSIAYIYTVLETGSAMTVDGAPPGPLGRLFVIPGGEVVEVPEEVAKEMTVHKAYDGIVRVDLIRTKTGMTYDLDKAQTESEALLESQDRTRWAQWVQDSVDDHIKRNKPVPPPPAPILAIIKRRGMKPQDFGIVPIGWEKPQTEAEKSAADENKTLRDQMAIMSAQLGQLLAEKKQREAEADLDDAMDPKKKK